MREGEEEWDLRGNGGREIEGGGKDWKRLKEGWGRMEGGLGMDRIDGMGWNGV